MPGIAAAVSSDQFEPRKGPEDLVEHPTGPVAVLDRGGGDDGPASRLLGCLPLEDIATRSGGRHSRSLGEGNRGPEGLRRCGTFTLWGFAYRCRWVRCECCDFGPAGAYLLTFHYKPGLSLPV
jgi:hypothetical protein